MPGQTPNLNLYKKNPQTDGEDTFNIETMLNNNWDKLDAAVGGKVDKAAGGVITGPVRVETTGREITAGAWMDLSANSTGYGLLAQNCYTANNDEYRFANTHASMGARGIRFNQASQVVEYFDTGAIATTADAAFTPVWNSLRPDVSPTAHRTVLRDSAGRAKVAAPAASDDIARKDTVDAVASAAQMYKLTQDTGTVKSMDSQGLDGLTTVGLFYVGSANTDKPPGFTLGLCEVYKIVSSGYFQRLTDYSTMKIYTRYYNGTIWSSWRIAEQTAAKDQPFGYAGLDGSGKVALAAMYADIAATPNTAVVRDSQGRASVSDPVLSTDITTKNYVDTIKSSMPIKDAVKVATTANITLSGTQIIDGIAVVAGDRVLVKNQSTSSQNGIYVAAGGAWTRSLDFDTATDIANGALIRVTQGTTNGLKLWELATTGAITIGTTSLSFSQIQAGNATTVNGYQLNQALQTSNSPTFNALTLQQAITTNYGTVDGGQLHYRLNHANNLYWGIGLTGASASSNAGGSLAFWAYDNNGAMLGSALDINRATQNVTISRHINFGNSASALNLNDAPIFFRSKDGADANHWLRYEDSAHLYTGNTILSTSSIDGVSIKGNRSIRMGVTSPGAVVEPLITMMSRTSSGITTLIEKGMLSTSANTVSPASLGLAAALSVANYIDAPNEMGLLVTNRYASSNTSVFEVGNLLGPGYTPLFTVRGADFASFRNRLFVDGGKTNMLAVPPISLAIGDHDTGLNWVRDGFIKGFSNGQEIWGWEDNSLSVYKNFSVGGTKSAIVTTPSFGDQLLFAIESPENRFEDFGEAVLDETGEVVIHMDPVFLETVEIYGEDYNVNITGIDEGSFRVPVRGLESFTVKGMPGARFMYRVAAWRYGYHSMRFNYAQGY